MNKTLMRHMVLARGAALSVVALSGLLPSIAPVAHAQSPHVSAPSRAADAASSSAYRSAWKGYIPFTDGPLTPWRAANDAVGGPAQAHSHVQAREAEAPDSQAAPKPGAKADMPAGHHHHHHH